MLWIAEFVLVGAVGLPPPMLTRKAAAEFRRMARALRFGPPGTGYGGKFVGPPARTVFPMSVSPGGVMAKLVRLWQDLVLFPAPLACTPTRPLATLGAILLVDLRS